MKLSYKEMSVLVQAAFAKKDISGLADLFDNNGWTEEEYLAEGNRLNGLDTANVEEANGDTETN